ncbi:WhiB family transcriptional regulator [Gordonia sp. CPCC 205515]|uniref:WhiB family transcriptional regulator n=1 Tax=Gordonia sp. CPCC 205515 TaxID=3140791 RepID=UPI003AF3759A
MTTSKSDLLSVPLPWILIPEFDVNWRRALCAADGENPEDWFPFPTEDFVHAAAVCALCPIRVDCERWGRAHRMSGVWGGVRLVDGRAK